MTTYYHVAGEQYELGTDLRCWNWLAEQGVVTDADWKWSEAEVGFDGDVVCLFETETEARDYQEEYGGRLLRIEIEDGDPEIRLTRVDEGFPAAFYQIPAYAITEE